MFIPKAWKTEVEIFQAALELGIAYRTGKRTLLGEVK